VFTKYYSTVVWALTTSEKEVQRITNTLACENA